MILVAQAHQDLPQRLLLLETLAQAQDAHNFILALQRQSDRGDIALLRKVPDTRAFLLQPLYVLR